MLARALFGIGWALRVGIVVGRWGRRGRHWERARQEAIGSTSWEE